MARKMIFSPLLTLSVFFLTLLLAGTLSYAEAKLPDLVITDLSLDKNCQVVVTIKNNGPGKLPNKVWTVHHPKSAGVYLWKDGARWGGATIWKFDPAKALQPPGGVATFTSNLKVTNSAEIKAKVDIWNEVKEVNKNNNQRTEKLSCKPVPPLKEDCVSFNPDTTEVKFINGRWKIVDGSHWMFDFGNNESEAKQALKIIKHYRMNQSCFVGRPDPSFQYLLVSGNAPVGSFVGEDCVSFNPDTTEVKFINGRWKIVDGSHWMFDFGNNESEAKQALAIIKKYQFRYSCFIGRPDPSFKYLRK